MTGSGPKRGSVGVAAKAGTAAAGAGTTNGVNDDHQQAANNKPHANGSTAKQQQQSNGSTLNNPPLPVLEPPSSVCVGAKPDAATADACQALANKLLDDLLNADLPQSNSIDTWQHRIEDPIHSSNGQLFALAETFRSIALPPLSLNPMRYEVVRYTDGHVGGVNEVAMTEQQLQERQSQSSASTALSRIYGSPSNKSFVGSQSAHEAGNKPSAARNTRYTLNTDDEYLFPWLHPKHPAYTSELQGSYTYGIDQSLQFSSWDDEQPAGVVQSPHAVGKHDDSSVKASAYQAPGHHKQLLRSYVDLSEEAYNAAHQKVQQAVQQRRQRDMLLKQNEPPPVVDANQVVAALSTDEDSVESDDESSATASSRPTTPTVRQQSTKISAADDDTPLDDPAALEQQESKLLARHADRTGTSVSSQPLQRQYAIMDTASVANFSRIVPQPAIVYPFELDTFQKRSIMRLERGNDVFVAAHTSAGKTVVAEYAIALALKHTTKVVYTSPIKTLSNQKFREFRKTFGERDIGIITGDVTIQPEASALIMTTEILRSMLYKGADLIRDLEYVIFDEIHYVNDAERGVVWEEVIILLPPHVRFVLLSATVSNVVEFVNWIGRTKSRQIYVSSTTKRPVPLHHYLWLHHNLYNVLDERGWVTNGYKQARALVAQKERDNKTKKVGQHMSRSTQHSWYTLIQHLQKKELLPVIIFSFSKKACEEGAFGLYQLDLLQAAKDKSEVTVFVNRSLKQLAKVDRDLPQVHRVKELVLRGIGVHHAGMLPILKEIVEILFSRGLVRVLFATETFAMGVNMPAKTVVFNTTRKHDGTQFRDLLSGEYTQMSGRAGRRGLDDIGVVIVYCHHDQLPDEQSTRALMTGKSNTLASQFRLTYNMILSLLRAEDLTVESMMQRSFYENLNSSKIPQQRAEIQKYEALLAQLPAPACSAKDHSCAELFPTYYELVDQYRQLQVSNLQHAFTQQQIANKYLAAGRVLFIQRVGDIADLGPSLGVVLREHKATTASASKDTAYVCLVLSPTKQYVLPTKYQKDKNYVVGEAAGQCYVQCPVGAIDVIGVTDQVLNNVDPAAIIVDKRANKIATVVQQLVRVRDQYSQPLTIDSPVRVLDVHFQMGSKELTVADNSYAMRDLEQTIKQHPCHTCSEKQTNMQLEEQRFAVQRRLKYLQSLLSDQNLVLIDEFESRLKVMQELKYIDSNRVVQLKGRVASEINTAESLLVTELLFDGMLADMTPSEIVAVLSCLICQEKKSTAQQELLQLPGRLEEHYEALYNRAIALANLQLQCGMDLNIEEWVKNNVNPTLMLVVYEWSLGSPFSDICLLTDVAEGSIVRCISRLDETCRDVRNAAKRIGDLPLVEKMNAANESIKRDIVFAASLYL